MTHPNQPQQPPYQMPPTSTEQPPSAPTPKKKHGWAKMIVLFSVLWIAGCGALINAMGGEDSTVAPTSPTPTCYQYSEPRCTEPGDETTEPASKKTASAKPKATKAPEPTLTRAQEEAIESAESYLEYSAFSKKGLIQQLTSEYGEGFAKKDAAFAVAYVEKTGVANWKAEAVEAAESYLDYSSFSKKELLNQLESASGEGFTHAEAVYAVTSGPAPDLRRQQRAS